MTAKSKRPQEDTPEWMRDYLARWDESVDPLMLMNDITRWVDPPPYEERWAKRVAAACEIAAYFKKLAFHAPSQPRQAGLWARVNEAISNGINAGEITVSEECSAYGHAFVNRIISAIATATPRSSAGDGERMDLLEKNAAEVRVEWDDGDGPIPPEWSISVRGTGIIGRGSSLRAACDAAMQPRTEPGATEEREE